MTSVLWFQGGACSGNTMSFINAAEPSVVDLIVDFGLEIVYHPTLSMELGKAAQDIFWSYAKGEKEVDIFVFEGSIIEGPNGTGTMDMFAERPMKDWVADIAPKAGIVVAIGDCATWGGLPAVPPNPSESRGLQFDRGGVKGGFLGPDFTSKLGLPVINIPGCPAHPDWISQIIVALAAGRAGDLDLDEMHRPRTFFTTFTQTGCTRVQFYNYKQDPPSFGQGMRTGCLFYEFGCRGPMTHSPCNRILWNRQSSKTRAGHVCTVMGMGEYQPLVDRYQVPIVVTGFEPLDVLEGIRRTLTQLEEGRAELDNAYPRAVAPEGNPAAQAVVADVFEVCDRPWRGIGMIPQSGWRLADKYERFDAEKRFDVTGIHTEESGLCRSGEVLQGLITPHECEAFGTACTPRSPLGAPMVSSEGACAAYYQFRRLQTPATASAS